MTKVQSIWAVTNAEIHLQLYGVVASLLFAIHTRKKSISGVKLFFNSAKDNHAKTTTMDTT